ncbi:ECF transporter S component, partial [archaeon]|nr:ECF transporter S component [archaeon]
DRVNVRLVASFIIATAWMVLGYFIAENIMYDQKAALVELPQNILQAAGSVVLASLLLPLFHRIISTTRG